MASVASADIGVAAKAAGGGENQRRKKWRANAADRQAAEK
jgi:hypothetical protein